MDRRADIWSFGVVLFELLTGRQLFGEGETISHTLAERSAGYPELSLGTGMALPGFEREFFGSSGRTRTYNPSVNSRCTRTAFLLDFLMASPVKRVGPESGSGMGAADLAPKGAPD